MDIHKWLSETVLPQQPPSPPGQREECHLTRIHGLERAPREKRGWEQSTSDSSLLDAPPQHKKAPPSGRVPPTEKEAVGHTDASHPTARSERSVSSEPYRRKPRRKTRPERYGPLSKDAEERGLHAQRREKDESNKERRTSQRKKASKSASGIVQSFQAKNVPRERLTLKPREKLGLFNKGRVSSPVKGRGLPDLVFSEMNFLQKHKDKAEANPPPGSPRKKRKRDHAHTKEDEISAYFTFVRPALADQDLNIQTQKPSQQKARRTKHSQRETPSVVDKTVPTVEPTDQTSYLKFGGRGPRCESGSYISWSESVRIPSVTPAHFCTEAADSSGQLDSTRAGQAAGNTDGRESLHSTSVPPITSKQLVEDRGARFQVFPLPPMNERLSRSHSLPQRTTSPRPINLMGRAARRRTLEDVASPSSMPPLVSTHSDHPRSIHMSSVPRSRGHDLVVQPPDPTTHRDVSLDRETEPLALEDFGQQTSSSLGQILQDCNTAFHERRIAEALQPNAQEPPPRATVRSNMRQAPKVYPTIRSLPSVRFAGAEDIYPPTAPTVSGPSMYDQQEEQCGQADQLLWAKDTRPMPWAMQDEYFDDDDEEEEEEEFDYAEQAWDEEAEVADYGVRIDPLVHETDVCRMDDRTHGRSSAVVKSGFWRPHKLY